MKIFAILTLILSIIYVETQITKGKEPFHLDYWLVMSACTLAALVIFN